MVADDIINGLDGNDRLSGGAGIDKLDGGANNDNLSHPRRDPRLDAEGRGRGFVIVPLPRRIGLIRSYIFSAADQLFQPTPVNQFTAPRIVFRYTDVGDYSTS